MRTATGRGRRGGLAGACLLAAMLVAAAAGPAEAGLIPGVPDVVYDPVNYASAVARYRQLYQQARGQIRQIEYAYDQARHLRDQARGWKSFRLSDFGAALRQAGRTMGEGVSLGYGNPELGEIFRRQFPRVPRVADGMRVPRADQLNALRDLAFAAVMSAQMQGTQIDVARAALDALRRGVVGAGTERQLQQAQAAVQTFQAEQDLLTRHTLLSLNQQLAAASARDARREMEEQVRAARADGRWRAWEEAVVSLHAGNLAARDRALEALRLRAGLRGGAAGREARDPRDLGAAWTGRGTEWGYEGAAGSAGGGDAMGGGMGGTEGGAGPREWDPESVQGGGAEPVDPWDPQVEGRPVFAAPAGSGGGPPGQGGGRAEAEVREGGRGPDARQVAERP